MVGCTFFIYLGIFFDRFRFIGSFIRIYFLACLHRCKNEPCTILYRILVHNRVMHKSHFRQPYLNIHFADVVVSPYDENYTAKR